MRHLLLVGCMTLLLVSVATANTIIAPNLSAGATLTASGGSFTGSIEFTNTSSVDQGLIAFSLDLLNGSTSVISGLNVTGGGGWTYEFFTGKQSNNGSPCNTTGNPNWFCVDGFTASNFPFHMGDIAANSTLTFNFSGSYTGTPVTGNLDLMANGCSTTGFTTKTTGAGPSVDCTGTKWAYSNFIGTPGGSPQPPPPVPEPASMVMLGSGLMSVGAFARRKFRK